MKKIFTFGAAAMLTAFFAFAHFSANTAVTSPVTVKADAIKWNKTAHDFGTVPMGPAAEVTFKFTNNGAAPLVIKSAQASCGCTTPSYTKAPVMPGETGEVKASYGTEGRPGFFSKTVTVTFDNGSSQVLSISGTVATDTGNKGTELK